MRYRPFVIAGVIAALATAPPSPAWAHGHDHRFGGNPLLLPFAAVAVVGAAAIALATAPVRAVAGPPGYYQPRAYYAPPQAYYYPPAPGYYAPPPAYYAAPGYYAPASGYYGYVRD